VTIETLWQPVTLLFLIGFGFGLVSPQLHNRRKMMFCKFLGDGFMGIYLITLGGLSGGCGALIAGTGALIQALTPHHYLKKTIWPRIGAALILSAISIYFVYQTPLDILPIAMVIICRFGELQSKSQHIRIVYWATCFPWMIYHFLNEFYLPFIACIIGTISLTIGIIRHHRPKASEAMT
jgi:hypothetical protein